MNAKMPKAYHLLPKSQQDALKDWAKQVALQAAEDQLNKDIRLIVDRFIKMQCIIMHDTEGYGEKRLTLHLWNYKRFFKRQIRLVRDDKQTEYINRRIDEIFKKDGFPQKFFDDILGGVETDD